MPKRRKKPKNYYQITGRPHIGLQDPNRFGLTREQVIILINENNWNSFYRNWHNQNKYQRYYDCSFCGKKPHKIKLLGKLICSPCMKRLQGLLNENKSKGNTE